MPSSIDKNPHNPLTGHEPAPTPPKTPSARPEAAKKPAAPVTQETFTQQKDPVSAKAVVRQPMLGALAPAGSRPQGVSKPQGTVGKAGSNSLLEHQSVLDAASNIMAKTQGPSRLAKGAAGSVTVSALGVSLAVPLLAVPAALSAVAVASGVGLWARRSNRQAVQADQDLQGDVDVLKAARERYRGRNDLTHVEKDTLAVAEQGLKGVKI
jgi:hypothetical protein